MEPQPSRGKEHLWEMELLRWTAPGSSAQMNLLSMMTIFTCRYITCLPEHVQILQPSNPYKSRIFVSVFKYLTFFFRGVGVRMVEPVYQSPSFDNILPSLVFLQVFMCTKVSVMSENSSRQFNTVVPPHLGFLRCRTFPLWSWVMSSGLVRENESWICVQHLEGRHVTSQHLWETR